MEKKTVGLLIGVAFTLIGVGLAFHGMRSLDTARASTEWPTTQGKITVSEVDMSRDTTGNSRRYTYRPKISYVFRVDGIQYQSNRVAVVGVSSKKPEPVKEVVRRYPKGGDVTVHYDPLSPEDAVLEPGVTAATYFPLGLGAILFIVGIGVVIAALANKLE